MNTATYKELESVLNAAGAVCGASESHGVLCGMICASGSTPPEIWLEQLLGAGNTRSAAARSASDRLAWLFSLALSQFHDTGLGLELLLPDDEAPLPVRSKALGEWCQGFLYGLATGGVDAQAGSLGHVEEIMHDLSEIAHVGAVHDDDAEAEETAYLEISEYVRICVLLCHEELRSLRPQPRMQ